jgi:hypothetical protein
MLETYYSHETDSKLFQQTQDQGQNQEDEI